MHSFDLEFQFQESPPKFLKRLRWNKRDSPQKKTNTPYLCGFNCLRKFSSEGVLSSVKKDSSFSCPLIRIDRTGEGGVNEGQRTDDLKLAAQCFHLLVDEISASQENKKNDN